MRARDSFDVLRRSWPFVLPGLAIGIITAVVWVHSTPSSYTSQTSVYVNSSTPGDDLGAAYQASLLSEQRMQSYQQFLLSRRVSQELLEWLHHLQSSSSRLAAQIQARAEAESFALTATVKDSDGIR